MGTAGTLDPSLGSEKVADPNTLSLA